MDWLIRRTIRVKKVDINEIVLGNVIKVKGFKKSNNWKGKCETNKIGNRQDAIKRSVGTEAIILKNAWKILRRNSPANERLIAAYIIRYQIV
jgi:23S rRNA maturation-related 3'-5' exoribonuclease YhaM